MNFQIHALPVDTFSHLFGLSDDALVAKGARRAIADSSPGYPCRVSLRDAKMNEPLILLNHTHHDHNTPYRASHAIFVIENATQAFPKQNRVPDVLRRRLLSVRGFNTKNDMVDADVVEGTELETVIARLFANADVAFIHLHNAKQGCFAARITRA